MEATTAKPKSRRPETDESRAERKRVQDRLAQRATRERAKNRITFLEQRLRILEAGDKQGEITHLTKIIDDLRSDNSKLRSALVKMRNTLDNAISSTEGQPTTPSVQEKPYGCYTDTTCKCEAAPAYDMQTPVFDPAPRHNSVSTDDSDVVIGGVDDQPVPPQADNLADAAASGMAGVEDFFDVNPNSLGDLLDLGMLGFNGWHSSGPSPFDFRLPTPDNVLRIARDEEKWHVSNGAFVSCLDSVKKKVATNATLDLHVPFKAAIWGWDSVGPEANHPVWSAMRQVDQRVFGTWRSKAQRIALMYVCQTLVQYHETPTKENLERVPGFFRPRPSQERIQHPAVIDFLIWPGLRDRLVFEHEKYTRTGEFSAAFVEHFDFHWPYSDREIFVYNPVTNRYEVSRIFLEYAYNFKNWTMRPTFFKKFPEMQYDIAATEETLDFHQASWTMN